MTITLDQPSSNPVIQVNGRYHYVESDQNILGQGSYGTVFLGHDSETDNKVAIKKVASDSVKSDELQILLQLNSDFVVGLRGTDEKQALRRGSKFTYMIMDLCDVDLHSYIHDITFEGKLGSDDLDTVTLGIANGYLELFNHDIIHRDIKPQNILITYETLLDEGEEKSISDDGGRSLVEKYRIKTAKLADFGISRVGSPNGSLKNIAGSPSYMAPEIGINILDEFAYDTQVDMWSIGVVLNECITGEVPFDESALCRMFLAVTSKSHCQVELSFPSHTQQHYIDIIEALLQLDPSKRLTPLQFHAWATATITDHDDRSISISQSISDGDIQSEQPSLPVKIARYLSMSELPRSPDRLILQATINALVYLCFGNYGHGQMTDVTDVL